MFMIYCFDSILTWFKTKNGRFLDSLFLATSLTGNFIPDSTLILSSRSLKRKLRYLRYLNRHYRCSWQYIQCKPSLLKWGCSSKIHLADSSIVNSFVTPFKVYHKLEPEPSLFRLPPFSRVKYISKRHTYEP